MDRLQPSPCPNCLDLGKQFHYRSLADLKQGLEWDCPWCTAMYSVFDRWADKTILVNDSNSVWVYSPLPRLRLELRRERLTYLIVDVSLRRDDFKHPYASSEASDSPGSLEQATEWFIKCKSSHGCCNEGRSDSFVPTRLIDVSQSKLVDTVHHRLERPLEYACLSHCWGGRTPNCITNQATLHSHRRGIPSLLIPRTFAEAIHVTKVLGLQYLWIDSLCIIQDSEEDWERESAMMTEVYSNAVVTIAATSASSFDSGLFTSPSKVYRMRGYPLGKVESDMLARPSLPHPSAFDAEMYLSSGMELNTFAKDRAKQEEHVASDSEADVPLLGRAWVLQERLLSRRILHFTPHELMFECLSGSKCQCGRLDDWWDEESDQGCFKALSSTLFYKNRMMSEKIRRVNNKFDDILGAKYRAETEDAQQWERIVRIYTGLDITRVDDVLPAISGAAKLTSLFRNGDMYCAGHFKSTLPVSLAWRNAGLPQRVQPRFVPTWSWFSLMPGPAIDTYLGPDTVCIAQLLDVECRPLLKDPTGRVAGGSVRLASRLHHATVERNPKHAEVNVGAFLCAQQYGLRISGELHEYFYPDRVLAEDYDGKDLWCLELTEESVDRHGFGSEKEHKTYVACRTSLVLSRIASDSSTVYERVGVLWTSGLPLVPVNVEGEYWQEVKII